MRVTHSALLVVASAFGFAFETNDVPRATLPESGLVGIYAIVERVDLEPNAQAPERIRIHGAFALVNGGLSAATDVGDAKKGYLYFVLPAGASERTAILREWNDIKTVAGTGQAIGFGHWFYFGQFADLKIDAANNSTRFIGQRPTSNATTDLRVRPATEVAANPTSYSTNAGIVKLQETGGHAATVQKLRTALRG